MEAYPSSIARAVTGVSPTQLTYWAKTSLVTPSVSPGRGRGTSRLYSFRDLVQLAVVARLLGAGISLQRVRKAVGYLRRRFPDRAHPLAELTLLTDGETVFHLTKSREVIVDTVRHGQLVFTVALGELVNDLRERLNTVPMPQNHAITVGDFEFPVTLTPDEDDGGYVVECPALPGCISQGDTVSEALDNIRDAAEGWLAVNRDMETRGDVPKLPMKRYRKSPRSPQKRKTRRASA